MDALVKFDYDKQQDDEISLHTGDVLVNVLQVEEGWCKGTLNGVTGMFPDNFVDLKPAGSLSKPAPAPAAAPRVEPPPATSKKERRAKVAFSYIAGGEDELTLNPGEIVVVLDEVEEGWWKGRLDGREGVFPSNFVEEIEDEAPTKPATTTSQTQLKAQEPADSSRRSASMVNVMPGRIGVDPNELKLKLKSVNMPTTTNEPPSRPPVPVAEKTPPPLPVQALSPSSSSSGLKKAKVIFLYDAENADEVSVREGDIVEVLQFEDETEQEGWWMVRCANGKQGLVPDNFVELIQNAPAPVPDSKPVPPQPQKPPPPHVEKAMPNLPPKVPKTTSEPPSEPTKAPPVGGVRLMPTGGLPVKSKSAVPLPTMAPRNDPPPPVAKMDPPRPEPHRTNEPDSGDLDIPRSDILDNKKMKDRPKMNSRRPPSRSSLHGDDNEAESPPSSATAAPTNKSSPGMARAPWQKEMLEKKKKPGPPPKPKPKPAAKPPPTADKEEEPRKTFTPTPTTAVPPPTHTHTPSSHSHPPPPANVVKPAPPVASKVSGTKPDQRPAEDTSGEWKEAFEKLREEFNTFKKQVREEMNDLIDDLDRERKKRAEMEIDIDRLRRLRDKH